MSAPEKIWIEDEFGEGHEDQWQYGSWDCRNAYDYVHEYIRADIADALVAAAYEAAAQGVSYYPKPHGPRLAEYIRKDLTPADAKAALEAVRREARAGALREAADLARENWRSWDNATPIECDATACEYISDAIIAHLDKETTE